MGGEDKNEFQRNGHPNMQKWESDILDENIDWGKWEKPCSKLTMLAIKNMKKKSKKKCLK